MGTSLQAAPKVDIGFEHAAHVFGNSIEKSTDILGTAVTKGTNTLADSIDKLPDKVKLGLLGGLGIAGAKLAVATKVAVVVTMPYVAAGAAASATAYAAYKYHESTIANIKNTERDVNTCLSKATELSECKKTLKAFAVAAGVKAAEQKEEAFNKYN